MNLHPHQTEVVERLRITRGAVVWHPTGSGKTVTAAAVGHDLLTNGTVSRVVVAAPKTVTCHHERHATLFPGYTCEVLTHEMFARSFDPEDAEWRTTLLIVDEAHRLRNYDHHSGKALTVKAFLAASALCCRVLLLTATPVINQPHDIRVLLQMVLGGPNWGFGGLTFETNRTAPLGSKTFDRMHGKAGTKKQYLLGPAVKTVFMCGAIPSGTYPSQTRTRICVPMSERQKRVYDAIERREMTSEVRTALRVSSDTSIGRLTAFLSAMRGICNVAYDDDGVPTSPKFQLAVNMIQCRRGRRCILYSEFVNDKGLGVLRAKLSAVSIPFLEVTGSMSAAQRQNTVQAFNNGQTDVLLISCAACEGMDTVGVRDVYVLEPSWHQERIEQIVGRAVRLSSHAHLPESERNVAVWQLCSTKEFSPAAGEQVFSDASAVEERDKSTVWVHRTVPMTGSAYCCICMDDEIPVCTSGQLACGHAFHDGCIQAWLRQSATCPLCRTPVVSSVTGTPSADVLLMQHCDQKHRNNSQFCAWMRQQVRSHMRLLAETKSVAVDMGFEEPIDELLYGSAIPTGSLDQAVEFLLDSRTTPRS